MFCFVVLLELETIDEKSENVSAKVEFVRIHSLTLTTIERCDQGDCRRSIAIDSKSNVFHPDRQSRTKGLKLKAHFQIPKRKFVEVN